MRFDFRLPLLCAVIAVSVVACDSTSKLTDVEHIARARELRQKGDEKGAVIEIRNALQKNPKSVDARIMLAETYLKQGSGKQAQNELEIAMQRGASAARLKLPMARAYLLQSDFGAAAKEATVTLATLGADKAALMEVEAQARLGMRQFDAACKLFDASREADPNYLKAYLGSATCSAARNRKDEARVILDQAIRVAPAEAAPWTLLGDIDRVGRSFDAAQKSYTKALELDGKNVDALLGRALNEAEANKLDAAQADLKSVATYYPGHPLANYITGIVRFKQGRYPEAKTGFETTLTVAPTHLPSILWLGLTNYVQRNYEVAATQLNQYLSLVPDSPKVKALLALTRGRLGGLQQATVDLGELGKLNIDDPQTLALIGETHTFLGNPGAGSQFLARAVEMQPDAVSSRLALAVSLLEKEDAAGAIKQLKEVLATQPTNQQATDLLIQALVRSKDLDGALREARAFESRDPKNPVAGNFVGSVLILKGDEKGARAAFEQVVSDHPEFFPAANNLALLAVKNRDLDGARTIYQRVLKTQPTLMPALLGLHSIERSQGRAAEAEAVLQRAVQAQPTEVFPAQLLAQVYLSSGRARKAVEVSEEAARAHPGDAGLLEARGLAYLALGEPALAIVPLNKLVQVRGDSADAFVYLSAAQTALKDRNAAKASLRTALKLDPKHYAARLATARIAAAEGRTDEAMATARILQREQPNDARGYVLEAAAFGEAKKGRDAVRVLKDALVRFPKASEVRLGLSRAQNAEGDSAGAVETLVDWRRVDPSNPIPSEALGETYLRSGRVDEALEAYRGLLKLQPNNVRALNNAAFLLRTREPQQALDYIQTAVRIEPANADVLDTMGQIQSERGDFKEAIATFRKANEAAPKNAAVRYHLAATLAKSGDKALARRELERLLAGSPSFANEADARALLAQLPKP